MAWRWNGSPRNGHAVVVGVGARISGRPNQKGVSLEDQVDNSKDLAERTIPRFWQGPIEYRVVTSTGAGERLDRPELAEYEKMLRSRECDFFILEDLGRLVRGGEAAWLLGIAVDHGTRVMTVHDGIDTADETWEQDALKACGDHVGHQYHTSRRIKQKLMNRFQKYGGAPARPPYGYHVPPGAKTYDEWKLEAEAIPVYAEWLRILRKTLNCSTVAYWLNTHKIPTGPYARNDEWDGRMVRRMTRNTLLMGKPARGRRQTVKHHETGRRVSIKNPDGPAFYFCPHLAVWSEAEFEEINAALDAKNSGCGRKPVNGVDPLYQVPKRITRFPGQHARCWYCGRQAVWGGNGVTENLMCSGSREWRCWNSIGFPGALAGERLKAVIIAELYALDGFDEQFRQLVSEARQGPVDISIRKEALTIREQKFLKERANVSAAMREFGPTPIVREQMQALDAEERQIGRERSELDHVLSRKVELPASVSDLRGMVEEEFGKLAVDSPEFGDLLRRLAPEFFVYLVRLCDGGHLLPRATVRLSLAGAIEDAYLVPTLVAALTRKVTIDLFDPVPQRERIRVDAVRLAEIGDGNGRRYTQREIARKIEEKPTPTAVQHALALNGMMLQLGLDGPYVLVSEPPADYTKHRRHLNPRYRFEPLEGYQRPAI